MLAWCQARDPYRRAYLVGPGTDIGTRLDAGIVARKPIERIHGVAQGLKPDITRQPSKPLGCEGTYVSGSRIAPRLCDLAVAYHLGDAPHMIEICVGD